MAQSRTRTRVISRGVIKTLGFAGAISTALVAPNMTVLLESYMKHLDKKDARRTLHYLKYRKLVEVKEKNGEYYYKLTSKGIAKFEKIILEELAISIPRKWDTKWRAVIFDIPKKHNSARPQFLYHLHILGFYKLQDSLWIHPFECEKQIGVLLKYFRLEPFVTYALIEKGNFHEHAIKYFKRSELLM